MQKPANLQTRIFLDSGNPEDTKKALDMLGFLDGQTTNPSLVAKNPELQNIIAERGSITNEELFRQYKKIIQEISTMIPNGSVSIEVYADHNTTTEEMLSQSREMNTWINNAHIKFPVLPNGLKAAQEFVQKDGGRVNMTLVFSPEQAAAVHAATTGATKGDVFLSPFVGRLDDIGVNGMSLIEACQQLYTKEHSHVEVLAASIRSLDHLLASFAKSVDIVTVPMNILVEWVNAGMPVPGDEFEYNKPELKTIQLPEFDLSAKLESFSIQHDLTNKGIIQFATDWNALIGT